MLLQGDKGVGPMNERLELFIYQLATLLIIFIIIDIAMRIYFWNENKKLFRNTMRKIELDKIKWESKIDAWKRRSKNNE